MQNYHEREKILPQGQKGCKKASPVTKDQLLIDKTVMKDCKKRYTNLPMAWINYKKNNLISLTWLNECMEMFATEICLEQN